MSQKCIDQNICPGFSISNGFLKQSATAKSLQSCPTLCDPVDCSLPGSSVHGIFQARVLEWDAIGDLGSIPGLGGSPGERNDNPLQYH